MDKEDLMSGSDLKNLWKAWNVQVAVLISLFVQLCLGTIATLRQRSPRIGVIISVWSAYVLADWAADFGIGRVSPESDSDSGSDSNSLLNELMAFWAPFFLLHFAGTDTITAFALPDNQLWLRQVPGFLGQVTACIYIFVKTLSNDTLLLPTLLIFTAAIIKYVERTLALYRAATSPILKKDTESVLGWLKRQKRTSNNEGIFMTNKIIGGEVKEVKVAYHFYDIIRGCFIYTKKRKMKKEIDDSFARQERYALWRITPREALRVMEIQLQLMYASFYTKVPMLRVKLGRVLRLVSFILIAVALGLFTSLEKKNFGNNINVMLTYTLLWVALCFDTVSLLFMLFSEQIVTSQFYDHAQEDPTSFSAYAFRPYESFVIQPLLSLRKQVWSERTKEPYRRFMELSTPLLFRKWRGTMSGFNLMKSCVHQSESSRSKQGFQIRMRSLFYQIADFLGAGEFSDISMHQFENPFLLELWVLILREIKPVELPVTLDKLVNLDPQGNSWLEKDRPFWEMLIVWHVATDLCFVDDENENGGSGVAGVVSKILSDYMLYLLILVPDMMSEVARIAEAQFKDTCDHAITLYDEMVKSRKHPDEEEGVCSKNKEKGNNRDEWKDFCQYLADNSEILKNDDLLLDAWVLHDTLKKLEDKWKVIGKAWVQMLSFAAIKCRTTSHVEQLSKGGEFLSLVWLLVIYNHGPKVEFQFNDPDLN